MDGEAGVSQVCRGGFGGQEGGWRTAVSDWRLQLIARIETSVLWGQMPEIYQSELDGKNLSEVDDKTTSSLMGIAWCRNPAMFSLLVRYQNSARRAYYRALKQLELVRTGKVGYLPAVAAADQTNHLMTSRPADTPDNEHAVQPVDSIVLGN